MTDPDPHAPANEMEEAAPTGPPADEEAETLRQQLQEAERQAAENYDQYLRAVAEMRNYKKRVEQERELMARESNAGLIGYLLPILDDFERAMSTLPDEKLLHLSWIEGIALIHRRLQSILEQHGLEAIAAQGQPFDPYLHEAILYEDAPEEQDHMVLADLQKGYKLHDRVLRPSLVKVGRGAAAVSDVANEQAPAND